jgi:hypothetical protein
MRRNPFKKPEQKGEVPSEPEIKGLNNHLVKNGDRERHWPGKNQDPEGVGNAKHPLPNKSVDREETGRPTDPPRKLTMLCLDGPNVDPPTGEKVVRPIKSGSRTSELRPGPTRETWPGATGKVATASPEAGKVT